MARPNTISQRIERLLNDSTFRQAFAGGHALDDPDYVLIAAAACEMHPAAVLKGAATRSVAEALRATTAAAAGMGVRILPAISTGGHLFQGEQALERAVESLGAGTGSR